MLCTVVCSVVRFTYIRTTIVQLFNIMCSKSKCQLFYNFIICSNHNPCILCHTCKLVCHIIPGLL